MKIYFSRILVAGGMLLTFSSCRGIAKRNGQWHGSKMNTGI